YGAMAEWSVAPAAQVVMLPDGIGDAEAAALANPAMSSMAALRERARLVPGETVLVNGVTGTSGRLAVRIARRLGAARVIGVGRDPAALEAMRAEGLDAAVRIEPDGAGLKAALREVFASGVDVVVDYLWGTSAARMLASAAAVAGGRRLRFVQVGAASGAEIALPGSVLRSSGIELMGSGLGSVSVERLVAGIADAFGWAAADGFGVAFEAVPFAEFERGWAREDDKRRTVFVM
ncbi:MAG: zinc-binding dehydrogenase, partial [Gluconacetobacter diazotrophicus]|nr:zinc-binding dehydrogenase [Gluconacetobacter diazotrophicus]